ncbi:MAG: YdeI/OmpD-associated family protein [Saprospiraceae bacterium]
MSPTFFANKSEFRNWIETHHEKETELHVGFYKVGSGKANMSWSDSVDVALCFGWIDGVRTSIDKDSYQIRFTPRKPRSIWSPVNIKKIETLQQQGLMRPRGIAAFEKRTAEQSKVYAFRNEEVKLSTEYEELFKANKQAWDYFQSLPPSYRKPSTNWVMIAKQEETRLKRLNELIEDSKAGTNKWKDHKYRKNKK